MALFFGVPDTECFRLIGIVGDAKLPCCVVQYACLDRVRLFLGLSSISIALSTALVVQILPIATSLDTPAIFVRLHWLNGVLLTFTEYHTLASFLLFQLLVALDSAQISRILINICISSRNDL